MFDQARRESDNSQIDDVLDEMCRQASDSTDLGRRFEQLCQGVLRALRDDEGDRVFGRVDVWDEWAGREGPADGIDLVAQRSSASGGDAIAIRCECHSDGRRDSSRDVDSFLAKSGSATFRARMLIHTTTGLSAHLQQAIDDQQKPCHVVGLAEIRRWNLDWWQVAQAVGALTPEPRSSKDETAADDRNGPSRHSMAGRPFARACHLLRGEGVPIAAIAAGVFMVYAGANIGALVIIGGIVALALRQRTRRRSATRPAGQPADNRRPKPRPQRRPDDPQSAPPRSDGWDDDERLDDDEDEWDDDFAEDEPRSDDEWEPHDRDDDLDRDDEHDPLDWDDEPYRTPASRKHRPRSWDDDDLEYYGGPSGGRRRRAESWETGDADYI